MGRTIAQILPLALAGTISPSGLLFVMLIMSGKENGRRNALEFVIGAIAFLIGLAVLIALTFKPAIKVSNQPDRLSGIIDLVLALLIVVIVTRSILKKRKGVAKEKKPHKRPYPVLGFVYMFVNISTLIPFIAGVKIVAGDGLAVTSNLPIYAILIVVTIFMVAFPVIISYLMPKSSEKVLGPVTRFMSKYGGVIAQVYFLVMAAYLVVHGVLTITGG